MGEVIAFPVTVQAKETLEKRMDEQDVYGFGKYKKALDHTDDYDWLEMGLDEVADLVKYLQCEMNRKRDTIKLLRDAYGSDDIFVKNAMILEALNMLATTGTGK